MSINNSVTLGRTNLRVNKNGFGALPIQRIDLNQAVYLLHKAFDNDINFYDTARYYSDSEIKLGAAFANRRDKIIIATKTGAQTAADFWKDLEISLSNLQTDYIDIYQFHNPSFLPKPNDASELYDAALEAKKQGKIRFIGITNHRLSVAIEALQSNLYDTLQFPFSYLSEAKELQLVAEAANNQVGFIAMKALAGGLITDSRLAYAYLAQFRNVLPIWGIQREEELDEFIAHEKNNPLFSAEMETKILQERQILSGDFCRGCGYCLPCPAGIDIPMCARMTLLLRRAPQAGFLTQEWAEKMGKIDNCINCGNCIKHCPYNLNTPDLLKRNYADYKTFTS